MINISDSLGAILSGKESIPIAYAEIYDTTYTVPSNGMFVRYYSGVQPNRVIKRTQFEPIIYKDWSAGIPVELSNYIGVKTNPDGIWLSDPFSVTYSGYFYAAESGNYSYSTRSNGGTQIYLENYPVLIGEVLKVRGDSNPGRLIADKGHDLIQHGSPIWPTTVSVPGAEGDHWLGGWSSSTGPADYYELDVSSVPLTNKWTIQFQIKTTENNPRFDSVHLKLGRGTTKSIQVIQYNTENHLTITYTDSLSNDHTIISSINIGDNQVHKIKITSGDDGVTLLVDGVVDGFDNTVADLGVGSVNNGSSVGTSESHRSPNVFYIDNLEIFNFESKTNKYSYELSEDVFSNKGYYWNGFINIDSGWHEFKADFNWPSTISSGTIINPFFSAFYTTPNNSMERLISASAVNFEPLFLEPTSITNIIYTKANFNKDLSAQYDFEVSVQKSGVYSWDQEKQDFGMLKINRLCNIYEGYITQSGYAQTSGYTTNINQADGLLRKFTGLIDSVNIEQSKDSVVAKVSARDFFKKVKNAINENYPNRVNYTPKVISGVDPLGVIGINTIMPNCYDNWPIFNVIETLALNAGIDPAHINRSKWDAANYFNLESNLNWPYTSTYDINGIETKENDKFLFKYPYGEALSDELTKVSDLIGYTSYFDRFGDLVVTDPKRTNRVEVYETGNYGSMAVSYIGDWATEIDINALNRVYVHPNSYWGLYIATSGTSGPGGSGIEWDLIPSSPPYVPAIFDLYQIFESNSPPAPVVYPTDGDDFFGQGSGNTYTTGIQFQPKTSGVERIQLGSISDLAYNLAHFNTPTVIVNFNGIGLSDYHINSPIDDPYEVLIYNSNTNDLAFSGIFNTSGFNQYSYNQLYTKGLPYDSYTAYLYPSGNFKLEGFDYYTKNIFKPVYTIRDSEQIINLSVDINDYSVRNEVIAVGQQISDKGYLYSKATDIDSISNPDAFNYVGEKRTFTIIEPTIQSQRRLDWLSENLLERFRRKQRNISVTVAGLPHIEVNDPIGIKSDAINMDSDLQSTFDNSNENIFYVTDHSSSLEKANYTTTLTLTSLKPMDSWRPPLSITTDILNKIYAYNNDTIFRNYKQETLNSTVGFGYDYNTEQAAFVSFDLLVDVDRLWVLVGDVLTSGGDVFKAIDTQSKNPLITYAPSTVDTTQPKGAIWLHNAGGEQWGRIVTPTAQNKFNGGQWLGQNSDGNARASGKYPLAIWAQFKTLDNLTYFQGTWIQPTGTTTVDERLVTTGFSTTSDQNFHIAYSNGPNTTIAVPSQITATTKLARLPAFIESNTPLSIDLWMGPVSSGIKFVEQNKLLDLSDKFQYHGNEYNFKKVTPSGFWDDSSISNSTILGTGYFQNGVGPVVKDLNVAADGPWKVGDNILFSGVPHEYLDIQRTLNYISHSGVIPYNSPVVYPTGVWYPRTKRDNIWTKEIFGFSPQAFNTFNNFPGAPYLNDHPLEPPFFAKSSPYANTIFNDFNFITLRPDRPITLFVDGVVFQVNKSNIDAGNPVSYLNLNVPFKNDLAIYLSNKWDFSKRIFIGAPTPLLKIFAPTNYIIGNMKTDIFDNSTWEPFYLLRFIITDAKTGEKSFFVMRGTVSESLTKFNKYAIQKLEY